MIYVSKSLFPPSLNKHSMIIEYQRLVRIDKIKSQIARYEVEAKTI